MRKFIFTLLLALISMPFVASDALSAESLKPIESKFICMVNNTAFDKEQIAVEVDGKTYFGCCSMCEARLQKDAAIRMATDPVSGIEVDKAEAVIGTDTNGKAYYFENTTNLEKYTVQSSENHTGMMKNMPMEHNMEGMMHKEMMTPKDKTSMNHDMSSSNKAEDQIQGTGSLHKIMAEQNKVNMTHGAIPAIQWPEMTMDFTVADSVDLSSFKPEDNVMFSLKLEDKAYVITNMHVVQGEKNHEHDSHSHTMQDMEK